jgi:hypothetical protein
VSLIRPLTRGLIQPITRPLLGRSLGGDALTPAVKALFASGEKGVMFDFFNAANLYTDSARTALVSASGDGIGSATDLSGNGKHASSAGSARPSWNSAGYATFDAFDDYLQTAAVDFSATDKITVVAAVRKATDAAAMVSELSSSTGSSNGSFYVASGTDGITGYTTLARGSASLATSQRAGVAVAAPDTAVVTAFSDISGDLSRIYRNGVIGTDGTGDKGTGNFGNYVLNIGARNAAGVFLNGRIYRLLVIGRALTTTERNTAERWASQPVGIAIP